MIPHHGRTTLVVLAGTTTLDSSGTTTLDSSGSFATVYEPHSWTGPSKYVCVYVGLMEMTIDPGLHIVLSLSTATGLEVGRFQQQPCVALGVVVCVYIIIVQ